MALRRMDSPWAHPPEGLLAEIFSYLPSFADRASCTGVSRLWRTTAREQESTAPPLLPCLLRPSTSGASCFYFFSGSSERRPTVPAVRFCGSMAGGWFVVARHQWRGYALLHLDSGTQIPLPEGLWLEPDDLDAVEDFNDVLDFRVGIILTALVIRAAAVFPVPANPDGHGHCVVAAITLGHHKTAVWQPGMERWVPLEAEQGLFSGPALEQEDKKPIMSEELEDVIYYSCEMHEGFFFLTTQEHLMVFDPETNEDGDISGDLDGYLFPGQAMAPPPEAGHVVAARYLVESEERLLMVKRFVSPEQGQGQGQHGTVSFQVFTLQWDGVTPRWERSAPASAALVGKMLFLGRGCSRAIRTGRAGPAFIYFLDDALGSPNELLTLIIISDKEYRCSDIGWCRYNPQYVGKSWPQDQEPLPGPANCSPWIWLYS